MNRQRFVNGIMVLVVLVGAPFVTAGFAASSVSQPKKPYDPSQLYPGPFVNNSVYFKPYATGNWMRGLNGYFPSNVVCYDALWHLKTTGQWSGHIKLDGSCGTVGEPAPWAVGNRLNYDDASADVSGR